MRAILITLGLLFTAAASAQNRIPMAGADAEVRWVPDEFVVVFKAQVRDRLVPRPDARGGARVGIASVQGLIESQRLLHFVREFPEARPEPLASRRPDLTGHYLVKLPAGKDLDAAMAAWSANPNVDHVEKIGIHPVFATPNDDYFLSPPPGYATGQWHYWDVRGIDADLAWDQETGDPSVIVGVLDTGVKYAHDDLGGSDPPGPADNVTNGNIWTNPGEIPGNGVDDDGNGRVDDVVGWDFVSDAGGSCIDADCFTADNDPKDGEGHGTHVAGTVAAITNNGHLVAGIAGGMAAGTPASPANGCRVMCLRIGWRGTSGGLVRMDWAAQAMSYVASRVDAGVNVTAINCSWGSSNSGGIGSAVNGLLARDVMVVAAAGNSASATAPYLGTLPGVMNVAATTQIGTPASFTNYGSWVDIAAPGVDVVSTWHNPTDPDPSHMAWAVLNGTSMAAPHVCGVAALLESKSPELTGPQKYAMMQDNGIAYGGSLPIGACIVNAHLALNAMTPTCSLDANFSASPLDACAPMVIEFINSSMGAYTSQFWDFGDGGTTMIKHPTHEYMEPGTYTVTLTVYGGPCQDTEIRTDYITIGGPPTADFEANPTSGAPPLDVQFTDLSTGATSWSWDFGDGGVSTEQNPLHTYTEAGLYTVSLVASNVCGDAGMTKADYDTVGSIVGVPAYFGAATRLAVRALPNPARGGATEFAVFGASGDDARIRILDLTGRVVRELAVGRVGVQPVRTRWDGRDAGGRPVPAGLYFVVARCGAQEARERVAVVR